MLLAYPQFLLKQAIRSPSHFTNPRVIESSAVKLPRCSVIHYLDYKSEQDFPTRDMVYLSNVKANKKVPVQHVTALTRKEDTTVVARRTLDKDVRAWRMSHTAQFRVVDLLQTPNADVQTHALVNYQILKGLYRYKTSATGAMNQHRNVSHTYWESVHRFAEEDKASEHFVQIGIPQLVPSKAMMGNILKLPDSSFARVTKDPYLADLIDLYKYLDVQTRDSSAMVYLTEGDCQRVTVELGFKGFSCFFKLSHLVGLSDQSSLESKKKITTQQLQRLLLLLVLKVQQKVNTLIDEETTVEDSSEEDEDNPLQVGDDGFDEDEDTPSIPQGLSVNSASHGAYQGKGLTDQQLEEMVGLDEDLDAGLEDMEGGADDFFLSMIEAVPAAVTPETSKLSATEETPEEETALLSVDYSEENVQKVLRSKSQDDTFEGYLQESKKSGSMGTVEVRSLRKMYDKRKTLKSPYSEALLDSECRITAQDSVFTTEDRKIKMRNSLVPEHLQSETVFNFDRLYLNNLYRKDILACVSKIEDAGVMIKDYQVEQNDSALGSYEVHKLTLKPYKGKESTVYFRLPVVDNEGEFKASGVKFRMRKQRTDNPICKISPTRVALTSNYGKLFVFRTERKSYDPYSQISDFVKKEYLAGTGLITQITPGNCFDNHVTRPNDIMAMSSHFRQFSTPKHTFLFDPVLLEEAVKKEDLERVNKPGEQEVIGYAVADKTLISIDRTGAVYSHAAGVVLLGSFASVVGFPEDKLPVQFAAMKVLGDSVPMGVVLAYYMGLKNLCAVTQTAFTLSGPRQQPTLGPHSLVLRFEDCKVVIEADTPLKKVIFGGFMFYKDTLKTVLVSEMESKAVYLAVLEQRGGSMMHLRELDILQDLFLDPITVDVLRAIEEPTEYLPLLVRACEMLSVLSHPDINDPMYSRIRGYDRVPGLMYRVLTQSVRSSKMGMTRGKIELDPYGVWNAVTQDTTVKVVEDSNPITDAKEAEAVTFSGADGLSKGATPEKMRRFHKNDIGLVSEATVDSSDVALNIYLTPYAKISNLRGMVEHRKDQPKDTLFSTSALMAPMSEHDDPKRLNFINIQNGHTIAAEGYEQPMLRTGHEYLMPYKVGSLYCNMAPQSGSVTSMDDKQLKVSFKDGVQKTYALGGTYGRMEGSIYKHSIVTDLQVGSKFAEGDPLTYNSGFFEKDWLDEKRLIMKFGKVITVALSMGDEVYEDSSSVSKELGREMVVDVVSERCFIIEFDKNIVELKSEGDKVDVTDSLFTLVDSMSDYSNLSSSSIDLLKGISNLSPKAKVRGEIFRCEIKYNGEASDMSPTLRKLATRLDRQTQTESESTDVVVRNNRVTSEYRSEGKNLMPRTLELKMMISYKASQAHGDKGVFGNQMKSVVSDVFRSNITSESGAKIEALFSYKSILNRVAISPLLMGTTNRLLRHVSPLIAESYFN